MIRKGEEYSFVELCLYLPNDENQIDGNIIISREIYQNGRNLCKINGRMVTVKELKDFMSKIIDIHGQQDNQNLLDETMHIKYLDLFSGNELLQIKNEYFSLYTRRCEILKELKNNYGDDKEKERKIDLLKYQLNEIEEASLCENEEDELAQKRSIILNSEKIKENLSLANYEISENAVNSISNAIRGLEKIEKLDKNYEEILTRLKSSYYEIQEVSRDIENEVDNNDFDEEDRKQIEERLDLIFSLKGKYGNTIEEILKYKKEIEKEIFDIENLEEYTNNLKNELNKLEEKMLELSNIMNKIRNKYAQELSNKINEQLNDLEMKNAKFIVLINKNQDKEFNKNGLDNIKFLISTNIGEEQKPLIKIASGGEMSRIMLAIKTVLADVDNVPVLVFDEIDTGISGLAAKKVASKLKKISNNHQVFCVTHLASIAAAGKHNYYISKSTENNKTKTQIQELSEFETIREIARISTGEITEISLNAAKELREKTA